MPPRSTQSNPRKQQPKRRKQTDDLPPLAVGHLVLRVANVRTTAAFYERIGLRRVWLRDHLAILELRGGTHLLLFPTTTTTTRRRAVREAPFDLMADDLLASFAAARRRRLAPTAIEHEERSGHQFFTLRDPDGHRLTVYSSHTEGRRV